MIAVPRIQRLQVRHPRESIAHCRHKLVVRSQSFEVMITNDSANNVNSDLGRLFFESEDLIRRCMSVQYLDECFGTLYDDWNLAHNLLDGKSWVDWM
jgi:hypothetical protein